MERDVRSHTQHSRDWEWRGAAVGADWFFADERAATALLEHGGHAVLPAGPSHDTPLAAHTAHTAAFTRKGAAVDSSKRCASVRRLFSAQCAALV